MRPSLAAPASRLAAACACAIVLAVPPAHAAIGQTPIDRPAAVRGQVELVDQSFDVAASGMLTVDLRIPDDLLGDPDARLVVTAHRPIERRDQVAEATSGILPRTADTVDIELGALVRQPGGAVRAQIQIERSTRTSAALQLARPGLYPIVVEVTRRGDVIADLVTFVHRLPDADEEDEQPIGVAIVMTTSRPVRIDPDSLDGAVIDEGTIAELDRLADSLESSAVPIAVGMSPAVAAALGDDAYAALADRLRAILPRHRVLPTTIWPLSPSQAASTDLATRYGRWLRDGEDALAQLATVPPSRSVLYIDDPLTAPGAALLRDLGPRLLLLPVDEYDSLPGSLQGFTDTTQLVQLGIDDETAIDALVVDRSLDSRLAATTAQPLLAAIQIMAEIVAAREEIDLNGGAPARHGLLLAAPDTGIIPAALLGPLTELLSSTPAVDVVTVDEMATRLDRLIIDGTEVVVPLAGGPGTSDGMPANEPTATRVALAASLALGTASTGSMLDADDPRLDEWQRRIELLPTTALDDARAASIVDDISSELAEIRSSVELPDAGSFTLTGRSTEIPVKLYNAATTPLRVRLRLTSTKLLFPDSPLEVVLPPGEYTEVLVSVEARANGESPVTLEVVTPVGSVPLGEPVTISARVNALRGLGPLVTGALLLVVLTWWGRHVRQSRRRRFALAHPSGQAAGDSARSPTHRSEAAADAVEFGPEAGGDQR